MNACFDSVNGSPGSVPNKCLCYSDNSDPARRRVLPTEHQSLNDSATQWRKEMLRNLGA